MKTSITASLAALALVASFSTPALAQKLTNEGADIDDPLVLLEDQNLPRNEFMLDSPDDVELVRFKTPHDIELCASPRKLSADGQRRAYPIAASWDNDHAVIMPGNCLMFDAQRLKVRSAGPLPDNVVLTGTIRVLH